MFDVIIKNGTIVDGSGASPYLADIGIKNGKIEKIGSSLIGAETVIDASGLTVTPGFIDSHSHSDNAILEYPEMIEKCEQGITTSIAGQCGTSAMPKPQSDNPILHTSTAFFEAVGKIPLGSNNAIFIGHGTIRNAVMGMANREPTKEELDKMRELLREGIRAGAMGISFGLIYTPSCYAKTDELIELAKVAAECDALVAAHIRNEGDFVIEAVAEFIEIIKASGARGIISHHKSAYKNNHGKVKTTIKMIEDSNREGTDIYLDVYPYTASSTKLSTRFVPKEYHADGKIIENLKNPEIRKKIVDKHINAGNTKLDWVLITTNRYAGKFISDIAREQKKSDIDTVLDIIIELNNAVTACFFSMCEEDIDTVMSYPRTMVCTDSTVVKNMVAYHPRLRGSFPRAIRLFVRERAILTLPEMIRRITSLPAEVYGLKGKGLIRVGYDADICIFDPEKITDRADFTSCQLRAEGLKFVIVGGETVAEDSVYTGKKPGRILLRK